MRVLIANKFYYNRGGDCIASIALETLLRERGHEVAFFSMAHPHNFQSEWTSFFPSQVDFQAKGICNKIKAANRIFFSPEVEEKFTLLLRTFKPDIVHLNNIHSQLSPLIGEIAHKQGIKVIWTLHDYKLVCPNYTCLRNGAVCEDCIHNGLSNVWKHRCMKDSLAASMLAYLEATVWNKKRLINNTNHFIAPSSFLAAKMIEGGFPKTKVSVISNYSNRTLATKIPCKKDYYCYIGRLSEEKGLKTLIRVAKQLPFKLFIVGTGPLKEELRSHHDNIILVGHKEWQELETIIAEARFLIIPSEWYENNPLSVIEALSLGTPVLGANIGGIPELINEHNGMLFEAGNANDMREKIEQMFNQTYNYTDICTAAREKYSAESYYRKLIEIYEQ